MMVGTTRIDQLPGLRNRFSKLLSTADDIAFLRMLWTLNALQTGRAAEAERFLNGYPLDAATEGILGTHAIYPWELETLANELLMTPKSIFQTFNCRNWNVIGDLVNLLRSIEGAEYLARREDVNILVEMGRIGARQFPWQRGYVGLPPLYRSAFIYGQGECAAYLQQAANLTPSDMTLVGFSLLSVFYPEPDIGPATDMDLIREWGITRNTLELTLERISCPIAFAREQAADLRTIEIATAYKPSILRRYPCLLVGHRSRRMIAPLPDLIMDRVTNGLFYDVVGGGGAVRDEVGRRFESYALHLLTQMLPSALFDPEFSYRTPLGPIATPDILMHNQRGVVSLAIECKASRMSVAARFGEIPGEDRGYEEIAKGVMQLWRFYAHSRLGIAPTRLADDVKLLILTLDEWFAGRSTIISHILERAHVLADASAHAISRKHRPPVAFCTISELEDVLQTATAASLLETVEIASGERVGWIFSILHQDTESAKAEPKDFPFQEALGDLLPWYGRLQNLADDQP